ncbi:MAG: FtsX-like permease family protein [Promethearchaeota archaeon]
MTNRGRYYLRQAFYNLKASALVLFAFSLTLSIISGLFIYSSSYQEYLIQDDFSELMDFNFYFSDTTLDPDLAYSYGNDLLLLNLIEEGNVNIQQMSYYTFYNSRYMKFCVDESQIPEEVEEIYPSGLELSVFFDLFDPDFYESNRFSEFFTIIEGEAPQEMDEILIDYYYSYLWGVHAGDSVELTLKKSFYFLDKYSYWDAKEDTYNTQQTAAYQTDEDFYYTIRFNISGIYASQNPSYRIGGRKFQSNYIQHPLTREFQIQSNYENHSPILSVYDFQNRSIIHPFQQLMIDMDATYDDSRGSHVVWVVYGMAGLYDRSTIQYGEFLKNAEIISNEIRNLKVFVDREYLLKDYLSTDLVQIYNNSSRVRSASLLISIPLTLFSILLAFFARKVETKTRIEEYLLLRSKGTSTSMLLYQYLFESIAIGIFAILIGILLGVGNFYLFQNLYNTIFGIDTNINLPMVLNWSSLGPTIIFGMFCAIIGSVSGLKYIVGLPTNQILTIMGSEEMDVVIDEKSLYYNNKKEKGKKAKSLEHANGYENVKNRNNANRKGMFKRKDRDAKPDYLKYMKDKDLSSLPPGIYDQKNLLDQMRVETSHVLPSNMQKPSNEVHPEMRGQEYDGEEHYSLKIKKIPKIGLITSIVAMLPIIMYFFLKLPVYFNISDSLHQIITNLESQETLISYLVVLSPALLTVGVLRIILIEKPRFFARISKKIAHFFIKDRDFLVGIEMIKQNQFKALIFILGLFSSTFVFMNIYSNTFSRHEIIQNNLEVGADASIHLKRYNPDSDSLAEFEDLDKNLLQYTLSGTTSPLFNNVVTVFIENDNDKTPDYRYIFFLNVEQYLAIITETNKPQPYTTFKNEIQNYDNYIEQESEELPGILVNDVYLQNYQKKVNDIVNISHQYYEKAPSDMKNRTFMAKIVGEINYMPGLFTSDNSDQTPLEFILYDVRQLDLMEENLPSRNVIQLFDIAKNTQYTQGQFVSILMDASQNSALYEEFSFYNQGWNDLSVSFKENPLGFYIVIYLDFILTGILLAVGIAILLISIQKKNKYFNGVLLARGFGKNGLVSFILSQVTIIFVLSLASGLTSGFVLAPLYIRLSESNLIANQGIKLPIYFNFVEFGILIGGILILTFILTIITFLLDTRKNISKYLHQF